MTPLCPRCGNSTPRSRKYCSPRCYWDSLTISMVGDKNPAYRPRIEKKCESCGRIFWVRYKERRRRFCARDCWLPIAAAHLVSWNSNPIPAQTRRARGKAAKQVIHRDLQRQRSSEFCKSRVGYKNPLYGKTWVEIPHSRERIVCPPEIGAKLKALIKLSRRYHSLKAKRRLPPPDATVLTYLRYGKGLSLRAIGRLFDVCHHTVKTWFTEAHIALCDTLPWNKGKVMPDSWLLGSLKGARASRLKQASGLMTKPEAQLQKVIDSNNLPFKYTGDGKFWIENLNPDFVNCNGGKVCIEVFGDYWHSKRVNKSKIAQPGYRRQLYDSYGWACIILWERELKRMSEEEIIGRIIHG